VAKCPVNWLLCANWPHDQHCAPPHPAADTASLPKAAPATYILSERQSVRAQLKCIVPHCPSRARHGLLSSLPAAARAVPAPATTQLQTFALQVQQRTRETRGAQRPYGNVSSRAGGAVRSTPQVASTRSTQPPGALAPQPQASRRAAFVRVFNLCSPSEFKSSGCPSYLASLLQPGRWHRDACGGTRTARHWHTHGLRLAVFRLKTIYLCETHHRRDAVRPCSQTLLQS